MALCKDFCPSVVHLTFILSWDILIRPILVYADDTQVTIQSESDYQLLWCVCSRYSAASNAKLNKNKSQYLLLGGATFNFLPGSYVTKYSLVKALGSYYDSEGLSMKITWKKIKSSICIRAKAVTEKYLSACRHIIVLNSFIWSKLWYIAQTFSLPSEASNFFWSFGHSFVRCAHTGNISYNFFELTQDKGCLSILPVIKQLQACAGNWWAHLIQNPIGQWQQLALHFLENFSTMQKLLF